MGVMNWIVQKTMINEAKRIAEWARKNYDSIKTQNPDLCDEEIHVRIKYDVDKLSNI